VKINPSVVCEQVGDDVLVLDSVNSAVVTLTGDSAVLVTRLLAGETVLDTEPGVDKLLVQGVLVSESSKGLSRRSLVMSGVAVGAGGALALSLPAAANASSASLLTPEFSIPGDQPRAATNVRANPDLVLVIVIPEDEFMNAGSFPDGFILEWSFSQSFDEVYVFDFVDGDGIYRWQDVQNGVTIPPERVDGRDLTIFVRVRSGNRLSPVVEIVLFFDDL